MSTATSPRPMPAEATPGGLSYGSAGAGSFAAAKPEHAVPAVVLVSSLMGVAATFLGFAVIAGSRGLIAEPRERPFTLAGGIVETSEITVFLLVVLVWPSIFPTAAWIFSAACWITMGQRIAEPNHPGSEHGDQAK